MPGLPRSPLPALFRMCAVVALALAGMASGCGESADQERLRADELARAKAEGRREARTEQAAADAKAEAARLRKELRALEARRSTNRKSTGGSSSAAPTQAGRSTSAGAGSASCGDGLSVNATTSCPFARSVRSAFENSGGASVVEAYSPVTNRIYTMRCTSGLPTVCRGGNNAVVYIR